MSVRMGHPDLGAVIEVPESAVPIYAASGWTELAKKDADALEREAAEQARATDEEMARAAVETLPPEQRAADTTEPAPDESATARKSSKKENS